MKKSLFILAILGLMNVGCSTTHYYKTSERCLAYRVVRSDETWKPTRFYQDESALYIQMPQSTKFIPTLKVLDQEFDQPTLIPYSYNNNTKTFRVEDNYNEYILIRTDIEEFYHDNVTIKCLRKIPVVNSGKE